jgi:hypothetical protein
MLMLRMVSVNHGSEVRNGTALDDDPVAAAENPGDLVFVPLL